VPAATAPVANIMDALKKSLAAARKALGPRRICELAHETAKARCKKPAR